MSTLSRARRSFFYGEKFFLSAHSEKPNHERFLWEFLSFLSLSISPAFIVPFVFYIVAHEYLLPYDVIHA
jgi:hypothetical protein